MQYSSRSKGFRLFTLLVIASLSGWRADAASCLSTPSGLIGWWPGDGNVNDIIAADNGTLFSGASVTNAGVNGNAFTFDGTNSYVQIPDSPALNPTNVSVEAWVRFTGLTTPGTTTDTGQQYIVFKKNTRNGSFEGYDLGKSRPGGVNDVFHFTVTGNNGQVSEVYSVTVVTTNVWYHVVGIRGPTLVQIYVNGQLEQQKTASQAQDYDTQPLLFGTSGQGWDRKFKGNLDEVSIYNRALSSNEVAAAYSAGAAGKCKALAFTGQPQGQGVIAGATAVFAASVSGVSPISYQWKYNGTPLAGATATNFVLTNIQGSNAGSYTLVASNILGGATSSVAVLSVVVPPVITNQPASRTNVAGTSASFAVGANNGNGTLSYQWRFNGTNITGATGTTLALGNVQTNNGGNYTVVVTNLAGGTTSAVAVLTIWLPPTVASQPQSQTNIQGTTAFFSASANGTAPFSYQWRFNGAAIGSATDSTLSVGNVQPINAGSYSVVITNGAGSITSAPASLTVWVPPSIATQPQSRTNVQGTAATFNTSASGTTPFSYQWQFNGVNIGAATASSLTVSNVQPANAGNYAVVVTNSAGSITSAPASLTVWVPPGIVTQPQSQTNIQGTTATFAVSASGTTPFSYQWQFNGNALGGATDAILTLSNVLPANAGSYTVIVTNSGGAITSGVAALTVWVPPGITTPPLSQTNIQGTTASFTVGASGTTPFSYQWQFSGTNISGATSPSLNIGNAQPGNAGDYAVIVTNSAGAITSAVATLTVWVPPSIAMQPQSQTNVQGTIAMFTVGASGTTPFSYQWQFNGNPLGGATGSSLTVSNLLPGDGGSYTVVVTNSGGSIISDPAILTVWVPPTISGPPVSRTNVQGTTAAFSVGANGTTPFAYQWQLEGGALSGATGSSLTLTNVQSSDAGNYSVIVTNFAGSITSAVAVLTVWVPPTISAQPVSRTNVQGTTATFNVGASGTTPFAYQWQLNGSRLTGATDAGLAVSDVQLTNAGNYSVIVTNSGGAITSGVAVLTVWVPPTISSQPVSRTNVQGTTATFSVGANGTTPFAYQWQLDGNPLGGATDTSLAVSNVQLTNAGNYSVIVTNSGGAITSGVAVLTVWVPPTISAQPVSRTNVQGTTASYAVSASGTTPFAYQWRLEGAPLNGATASTLSVSNVQSSDAGNYTVVVTNSGGSITSAIAALTVWVPPTVSTQPQSRTNVQGTVAIFNVSALGTAPFAYQWQFNGGAINGATGSGLSVSNVQPADAGIYTAIVTNLGGSTTSAIAVLTVWVPPTITNQPLSRTNVRGTTAIFSVAASGTTPFSYQWNFNGQPKAGATQSGLTITNVQPGDAGNYTVVVTNSASATTSGIATLTVLGPAEITVDPGSRTNLIGTTATFSVSASGTAPLSYQWRFNNVDITAANGSDLTLTNVQPGNAGNYRAVVTNIAGIATSSVAALTVWVPPSVASQPQSVAAIAGTNVNFNVTAAGTAPFSYQWTLNNTLIPGATLSSITVSNILPTNAGNYRVTITNVAGSITSSPALLTVLGAPTFTAQPSSRTNVQGTTASFSATTTGTLPQGYQWLLGGVNLTNGGRIIGAGSNSVTILNVQPGDAGNYTMVASNIVGMATSTVATLTVTVPPSIVSGPSNLTVPVGSNATLSVTTAGTTPMAFKWIFKGSLLPGATGATLTLTNVQTGNAGYYAVAVTNVAGATTSSVALLSVVAQPVFWYADNSLTNSANTGTSWANAWTNLASIVWGTGGIKAGHTLYISGGSTSKIYTNQWAVGASGVPGSPIHIAIDGTNTSHNGSVIFDYSAAGNTASLLGITCLRDYVTIDGNVGGKCNLVIRNCRNIFDDFSCFGIYADSTTGVIIDHLMTTNCDNPIRIIFGSKFRISNCDLRQVGGDAAIHAAVSTGLWDENLVFSNHLEMMFNTAIPAGASGLYYGPDGIQCGNGISIFGNTFHEVRTTNYTSSQHPDFIQAAGDHTKIYGNEFINIGDSAIDYGLYDPIYEGVLIYNNLFRIEEKIDDFPDYIRIYNGNLAQLNDVKIFNNTFTDNNRWTAVSLYNFGTPTGSGNEIKNNIFYNCGGGRYIPDIYVDDDCNFGGNTFKLDGNIYFNAGEEPYVYFGRTFPASAWVDRFEPHGRTNEPSFVSYCQFCTNNDFHLSTNDTAAVNVGLDIGAYFTTDKDGVARPQGAGWDIGAYEYNGGGALASNLSPIISAITQNAVDADPAKPGVQVLPGTLAQYSASISDPNGDPLSWQWTYAANGNSEVFYQTGSGTSASVSYTYPTGSSGVSYLWKLRVTDGHAWSESRLPVEVVGAARTATNLDFEAESGVLTLPFVINDGYVFQPVQSGVTDGGRAAYNFSTALGGNFIIQAVVDSPTFGERSFYVNIDVEPSDPYMIWEVPISYGFTTQTVGWQGNGACITPQFSPVVFNLTAGAHQLIVRGRDSYVKLDRISLVPMPSATTLPATEMTFNTATLNGIVNPGGTPTTYYFQYGLTANYGTSGDSIYVGNGSANVALTQLLTGLTPNTVYHYRILAYNSSGMIYGADQTFTTTLAPSHQGNQYVYWTYTIVGRVYYLEYKNNLTDPAWTVAASVVGDGALHALIDPSASVQQRFYRLRVVDLPKVTTLDATGVTGSGAALNGTVNPTGNSATAYFEYGPTSSYGNRTASVALTNGITSIALSNALSGLPSQTTYHFRLVAYNSSGTNYGADLIFTTASSLSMMLHQPTLHGSSFTFSLLTVSGHVHYVEYKTNLSATNWIPLTNFLGNGATGTVTDPSPIQSSRFYRVRLSDFRGAESACWSYA